jgi:hypothetical protein
MQTYTLVIHSLTMTSPNYNIKALAPLSSIAMYNIIHIYTTDLHTRHMRVDVFHAYLHRHTHTLHNGRDLLINSNVIRNADGSFKHTCVCTHTLTHTHAYITQRQGPAHRLERQLERWWIIQAHKVFHSWRYCPQGLSICVYMCMQSCLRPSAASRNQNRRESDKNWCIASVWNSAISVHHYLQNKILRVA